MTDSSSNSTNFSKFSLTTLLLLMATIAIWLSTAMSFMKARDLKREIETMSRLAPHLIVDDPNQFQAVQKFTPFINSHEWSVYAPAKSRICWTLHNIKGLGYPKDFESFELVPGTHQIQIRRTRSGTSKKLQTVRIKVDGEFVLDRQMPESWCRGSSSSVSQTGSAAPEKYLPLLRLRSAVGSTRDAPVDGILLWIQDPNTNLVAPTLRTVQ